MLTDKSFQMCRNTWIFFSLILLLLIHLSQVASQCGSSINKQQDKLALYKITLNTYWTRIRFPKNYPNQSRAPAQFGKLIGRTHDRTYSLYRLGTRLSTGITHYIETGQTHGIVSEGNLLNVLDSFTSSGILRGDGTSTTRAFFDSNHTLVSIVSRISPSPDWFIGVDSFQLCVEGNWIDSVTVELDPLDAGTNEGITFTAPNQRTWPQNLAFRITSNYPNHPAGSFYYPNLLRLPPIATLSFTKLKEYTLTDVYHDDEVEMDFVSIERASSRYSPVSDNFGDTIYSKLSTMETGGKGDNDQKYRYSTKNNTQYQLRKDEQENARAAIIDGIFSSYKFPVKKYTHNKRIKGNRGLGNSPMGGIRQTQSRNFDPTHLKSNRSEWQTNGFFRSTGRDNPRLEIKNRRFQSKGNAHRVRAPRDCKMSDWSAWSACSRSCGVGETQRVRKIIIKARRGGRACHPLKETKWCGSATPCPDSFKTIDDYFVNK